MQSPQKSFLERINSKKILPFLIIFLLNLLILVIFGSVIIVKNIVEAYNPETVKIVIEKTPPPPPPILPESSSSGEPSTVEPQPQIVPPTASVSVVTTTNPIKFSINTQNITSKAINLLDSPSSSPNSGTSGGGKGLGSSFNPFGGDNTTGTPLLVGTFYDLKQTNERKPTGIVTEPIYDQVLIKFIAEDWNEKILEKFFKSKSQLSTGIFAITNRPSVEAPRAFHLDNVQPNMWVIHYKGKVVPPTTGNYRFVGYGDNVLTVALDGKIVFDGGLDPVAKDPTLLQTFPHVWTTGHGLVIKEKNGNYYNRALLRIGKTFQAEEGKSIDMQVLIGDGGGTCGFYLYLQNMDETYDKDADDTPHLPFFKLVPEVPNLNGEEHPNYSTTGPTWKSVQ